MLPISVVLLPVPKRRWAEVTLVTIGLSILTGTLILYYWYLIWAKVIDPVYSITLFLLLFILQGIFLFKPLIAFLKTFTFPAFSLKRIKDLPLPIKVIGVICLVVIIKVLYFGTHLPFIYWDDLARYAYWGNKLLVRKEIDAEVAVWPIQVPLSYTYAFLSAGWVNEYLAKVGPMVMGLGAIWGTYLFARLKLDKGWSFIAVWLLLISSAFSGWLFLGYVDVPTAFGMVMAMYFFYLLTQTNSFRYAILSGIFLCSALWTKHAAFPFAVSIFCLYLLGFIPKSETFLGVKRVSFNRYLIVGLVSIVPLLSWYIRTFSITGTLFIYIPDVAKYTLETFFPFITYWSEFGYFLSVFLLSGVVISLVYIFRNSPKGRNLQIPAIIISGIITAYTASNPLRHPHAATTDRYMALLISLSTFIFVLFKRFPKLNVQFYYLFLWVWLLPYQLLWWNNFSLDPRYLVTVLPIYVLMVVSVVTETPLKEILKSRYQLATLLVILLLSWQALYRIVNLDYFTLSQKNLDQAHQSTLGETNDVIQFLNTIHSDHPLKIVSNDNEMSFYILNFDLINDNPPYLYQLLGVDYYGTVPSLRENYAYHNTVDNEVLNNLQNNRIFQPVFSSKSGNFKVYKINLTKDDFLSPDPLPQVKWDSFTTVNGIYTPGTLPGSKLYPLKIAKENISLLVTLSPSDKIAQTVSYTTKRSLELKQVCLLNHSCQYNKNLEDDLYQKNQMIINYLVSWRGDTQKHLWTILRLRHDQIVESLRNSLPYQETILDNINLVDPTAQGQRLKDQYNQLNTELMLHLPLKIKPEKVSTNAES